jgi:hypothetical protein
MMGLQAGTEPVSLLSWSPCGSYLLAGHPSGSFRVWQTHSWWSLKWSAAEGGSGGAHAAGEGLGCPRGCAAVCGMGATPARERAARRRSQPEIPYMLAELAHRGRKAVQDTLGLNMPLHVGPPKILWHSPGSHPALLSTAQPRLTACGTH